VANEYANDRDSMSKQIVTHGVAMAGDVRIAYQTSGEGPPLVCCHAMGWDHTLWDFHRARFSASFRLITFDQRGSGDSDHPPFIDGEECLYTVDTFGDDLRAVLDELDIEKAHVIGYSMGAVSALSFATRWPERVDRLILVSSMASRLPEKMIERARIIDEMLKSSGLKNTYEFYFSGPLFEGESNKKEFKEKVGRVIEKATLHGFQGCFRVTIDRPSMVDELKKIQASTLVLVGERDEHYLIEADLLVEEIPQAKKVVVKNAGHALTAQSPDSFEAEVLKFLTVKS